MAKSKDPKSSPKNRSCNVGDILAKASAVFFLLQTLFFVVFFTDIRRYLEQMVRHQSKLVSGTAFFESWTNPPFTPRLKINIFNVTNHQNFLLGKERLHIDELGPFTYEVKRINKVESWNSDKSVVNFRTKANYRFLPEESIMSDQVKVIMPNTLFLSGMLNTLTRDKHEFLKKNFVWPMLTSTGFTEDDAFQKLSVDEFVWGQENDLACVTATESEEEDEFFDDFDNLDEDMKQGPRIPPPNFLRHDGKCMFGALAHKNDTFDHLMSIHTGLEDISKKGTIVSRDGYRYIGAWKEGSDCDRIEGKLEPSALPPPSGKSLDIFMGIICQSVRLQNLANLTDSGIALVKYSASPDTFSSRSHDRHCLVKKDDPVLPDGAMYIRKCTQGSPMAVSFPRFLYADSW